MALMSTLVRFFTLLTIAAAGFALPLTCAQSTSATDPLNLEIPAFQVVDSSVEAPAEEGGVEVDRPFGIVRMHFEMYDSRHEAPVRYT